MSLTKREVIFQQVQEQLADYEVDAKKKSGEIKKLRSCLQTIAEKVCDSEYGENQLSGKNLMTSLDDIELRDFIIKNTLKQKINFSKNIRDLQNLYIEEINAKDEMAKKFLAIGKERDDLKESYTSLLEVNEDMKKNQINIASLNKELLDKNNEYEKKVEMLMNQILQKDAEIQEYKIQLEELSKNKINEQKNKQVVMKTSNNQNLKQDAPLPQIQQVDNRTENRKERIERFKKEKQKKANKSNNEQNHLTSTNNIQPQKTNLNQNNLSSANSTKDVMPENVIENKKNNDEMIEKSIDELIKEKTEARLNKGKNIGKQENHSSIVYIDNTPYDVNDIYNTVDIYQLSILKIIGESGICETLDIVDKCCEKLEIGSQTNMRKFLTSMVDIKLLETETISTPIRKRVSLHTMTSLGEAIYKKEYGRNPVKNEKKKILEMHATLPHGYCIKDTVRVLSDLGYYNISMDSSKNSIEVAKGRRYVPDIIANFDDKTVTYWEVELGHHHDGDFYEKLEKAAKVTSLLYIVTNDNASWEKVKKQVVGFKLKLKQEQRNVKLTIILGTMTQLSKKSIFFSNPDNKFIIG